MKKEKIRDILNTKTLFSAILFLTLLTLGCSQVRNLPASPTEGNERCANKTIQKYMNGTWTNITECEKGCKEKLVNGTTVDINGTKTLVNTTIDALCLENLSTSETEDSKVKVENSPRGYGGN